MAAQVNVSGVTVYATNCPGLTINVGDVNLKAKNIGTCGIPADLREKDNVLCPRRNAIAGTTANLSPEICAGDLMMKLAREIHGDTLKQLLLLYKLAIGSKTELDITTGYDLLIDMQNRGRLEGDDFIFLQYLLLKCQKFDLSETVTNDIQEMTKRTRVPVSYLHSPDINPMNGFRYAHFHVNLKHTVVDRSYLQDFASQLVDLLQVSEECIMVAGATPSYSLWITFLLPVTAVSAILKEERRERVGAALQALGVDQIDLRQQRPAGRGQGSGATAGAQCEGTPQTLEHHQHSLEAVEQRQSDISENQLRELADTLLSCDVCNNPFDSERLKPLMLQCTHSYCCDCLDHLGKDGDFPCPHCRAPTSFKASQPSSKQFKVDHIRIKVLDWTHALQKGERQHHDPPVRSQSVEKCSQHPEEEAGLFCTTCRKLLCSSCADSDHKSHDVSALSTASASAMSQWEMTCDELQQLVSTFQQAASGVKGNLGALDSQKKAALKMMDDDFDRLEAYLRQRRQTAREELEARVKEDRLLLEGILASHESTLSAAQSTLRFGRSVVLLGSESDLLFGLDQAHATLRDLATRRQEYQVTTMTLPDLTEAKSSYEEILSDIEDVLSLTPFQWKKQLVELKSVVEDQHEKEEEACGKEQELSHTLVVRNLPDDMDEDYVADFFEHRRCGGFAVDRVDLDRTTASALVCFQEEKAVAKVLSLAPFDWRKKRLEVKSLEEDQLEKEEATRRKELELSRTLVVRNLPADVDEEDVADFFEHRRRGGFVVDKVDMDRASASALVRFQEEQGVAGVLSLAPFNWRKKTLEVKTFVDDQREKEEETRRKELELSRTLVVRNLPDDVDEDYVADFFEHRRRGGFAVDRVDLDRAAASALVCFQEEKGADTVLEHGSLEWMKKTLEVESYRQMMKRKEEEERERERALSCMLVVQGLPADVDENSMARFFEHWKFGGFHVDKVDLDRVAASAIVHFQEERAVEKVLQLGPHQFRRVTLKLSSYRWELKRQQEAKEVQDAPSDVVEVTGLPGAMSEAALKEFFERRKTSGGHSVVKVKLHSSTNSALVFFEDPEAVESTLKKAPFLIGNNQITVKAHTPSQDERHKGEGGQEGMEEFSTVAVRGIRDLTKDELELYFGNTRRSGGGQLQECKLDEKEGVAFVVFESAQVATRVCERAYHTVKGRSLLVTLYKESPCYPDRVLLSGLSPKVSREGLVSFLEAKTHLSPMDIRYGEDETAVVIFNSDIDLAALRKILSQRKLRGRKVKASKVPLSDAVLVEDVPDHMTKDAVEVYFDNNRKSGGEDVQRVRCVGEGTYIVHFADPQVASRVSRRGQHKFGDAKLQVSLYLECLGPGGGHSDPLSFLIPPPLSLPWPHPLLPCFLKESASQGQVFRDLLQQRHAQPRFDDVTTLTVTCILTSESRDGKRLAKTWKEDVETDIRGFLDRFRWEEIRMTAIVFAQVEKEKGRVPAPRDAVVLHSLPQDCLFQVLGEPAAVSAAVLAISKLQEELELKLEAATQRVTETVSNLASHKLRFLLASGFPKAVMDKHKGLGVYISLQESKVTFNGMLRDVKLAMTKMYERTQALCCSRAAVSPLVESVLQNSKVQQRLAMDLEARQVTAVWEVSNQQLLAWAASDQEAVDTVQKVRAAILEQRVTLDPESLPLLDTTDWSQAKAQATEDEESCMEVRENRERRELDIAGLDLSTVEDIWNFFVENTVYRSTLCFPPGRHSFMVRHLALKIRDIEGNYVREKVRIQFGESSGDFQLRGTKAGLLRAEEELRALAASVTCQKHTLSDPVVVRFLQGQRGSEVRALLEKDRCIIRDEYDLTDQPIVIHEPGPEPAVVECQDYRLPGDRVLHVVLANMTTLKVDVIVNAANTHLKHTGGLAKAISDKAGPALQEECEAYIKKHRVLADGEVAVTEAGRLPCQLVIHAVGPRYQRGEFGEEAKLKAAVTNSLLEAEKLGLSSIALPAISCGTFGYPAMEATQVGPG